MVRDQSIWAVYQLTGLPTAWRVDFNLALSSFENNVKGTRRLVDLALTSPHPNPARILFVGSVSVFQSESTIHIALKCKS